MYAEIQPTETLEARLEYLEKENARLREREFSILKALPELVFILNTDESFSFLNNTCLDKFKFSQEDILHEVYLKNVITQESLFHLHKLYILNKHSDSIHAHELTGIRKDGSLFKFTAYITKIISNHKLTGFIGVGFDITEQKKTEDKLREANLAKAKFLSIIAHDLRNPFNSLVGFSSLLLMNFNKYNSEKIRDYIQHMSTAANQGYQLLENLLEWARANTGKIDFTPSTINLYKTAIDAYGLLIATASKKEIAVEILIPESIHVFADSNMLLTIIRNLLANAIKFTPRGGSVIIKAYESTDYAYVEVVDTGIGIAADKIPNIFNICNDYISVGTEKEKGTGLGLVLCNEFLNINNGKIEVNSEPGEGSTFKVTLPRFNFKNRKN
jgi:two-component system sensor histidine kinase/response regulator